MTKVGLLNYVKRHKGNESLRCLPNQRPNLKHKSNWVLTEIWNSKEQCEKYIAFEVEDGTAEAIGSLCKEAP